MKHNFNSLTSKDNISIKNIRRIDLFATIIISSVFTNGMFFSQAMADNNSTGIGNGSPALDNTSTTITSNQNTISAGGQVTLVATVTDSSSASASPAGSVMWSDGNGGGTFSSAFCDLSSGTCTTSYTPSSGAPNSITITATYGGDATHRTNAGTSGLTINAIHATTLSVTPNPATV
ncbi:MAG: hypothetical protein ACYC6W_09485 [Nitrosotalea sp.]